MAHVIAKEEIPYYIIQSAGVDNASRWKEQLQYAMRLGNAFKGKTTITFATTEGALSVATTVWSLMGDYIQLKAGITIPLKSVVDIHF